MNCRVVVEAAVPVYDVGSTDEAVRIAISKTGEMLNPDLNYVEIEMGDRQSPSGEPLPPAFVAADEALVALELEMTVFNVEDDEHAARIARKEIGQRMHNIPLKVLEIVEVDEDGEPVDDEGEEEKSDRGSKRPFSAGIDDVASGERDTVSKNKTDDDDGDADTDEDILPEFEDLVEES